MWFVINLWVLKPKFLMLKWLICQKLCLFKMSIETSKILHLHNIEVHQWELSIKWKKPRILFPFPCMFYAGFRWCLEKAMAPHSSTLAWKIPWMEEPGRLQSMGSLRVGHDWVTSLSLFTFMHWRRKWQPTPVFLPGESQGWGSLVGYRLWGRTELDTTEAT